MRGGGRTEGHADRHGHIQLHRAGECSLGRSVASRPTGDHSSIGGSSGKRDGRTGLEGLIAFPALAHAAGGDGDRAADAATIGHDRSAGRASVAVQGERDSRRGASCAEEYGLRERTLIGAAGVNKDRESRAAQQGDRQTQRDTPTNRRHSNSAIGRHYARGK